jgi:TetR/AcrR family transcriptional regulator, cholesterol catabolism regulator
MAEPLEVPPVASDAPPIGAPITGPATAEMILLNAASLFRRDGYRKVTTRDLGRAVGIRGPSVYYHFKTKEDILYGICTESLRRISERVATAAATVVEPLPRLRTMIEAHISDLLDERDMHATTFMEMRWLSGDLQRNVAAQRDRYETMFVDAIKGGQDDGSLRSDIGARDLTLALLGLMNWTVFWYRPGGALSSHDLAGLLSNLFLEGASPRR